MRVVFLLIALVTSCVGCGVSNDFCDANYERLNGFCTTVVGYDAEVDERLDKIEVRLDFIQTQIQHEYDGLNAALEETTADIATLWNLLTVETDNIGLIQTQVFNLDQRVAQQLYYIESLQQQLLDIQTALSEIAYQTSVVGTVDFCGNAPNKVDEIGLIMSNGEIVVFFQNNDGGRLASLGPGSYVTTDGTNCRFNIDANGVIHD